MEFRLECGRCRTPLPEERSAYFCANECTVCPSCVRQLKFVCPNCQGELVRRPRRAKLGASPRAAAPAPDPKITIRRATTSDADRIAPLFDAYRVFYEQSSELPAARRFLLDRLERGESVVFVAEREGVAVGFVQLYASFTSVSLGPIYVLNDLYVIPGSRRGGVGALLLGAAGAFGRAQGAHYLELSTAVDNPAQLLYEASGWLPDREFLHYELPLRAGPRAT
jgi:hypothetical protein